MGMDDHGGDLIEGNAAQDLALGLDLQEAAITGQMLAIPGNIDNLIQGREPGAMENWQCTEC